MSRYQINKRLLEARNYRQFLLELVSSRNLTSSRGGLSATARKSNLSKSFLTEVIKGKKNLSPSSLSKIILGLKLSNDLSKYFTLLAAMESEQIREVTVKLSKPETEFRLNNLRLRIQQKINGKQTFSERQKNILNIDIFSVFAALGSLQKGASFSEILLKTNIEPSTVQKCLELMMSINWVIKKSDRYFAQNRSLDFENMGDDISFKKAFAGSCLELSTKVDSIAGNSENLVFFSAVPMNAEQLHNFKDRIRSTILDIIDEFQDDEGNLIKKITMGIY